MANTINLVEALYIRMEHEKKADNETSFDLTGWASGDGCNYAKPPMRSATGGQPLRWAQMAKRR